MRIVLLSHADAPWTEHYSRFLLGRGHEVHLVTFHPKPVEGVVYHYVGASIGDGSLPKWIYLWRVPRVWRLLRRIKPDVVLATYYRSNGLVGALTKCAPLVVSTRGVDHDFSLPFGLGPTVSRWIAARADALHASSPELVEKLVELGVPGERFEVIPVGTDADVFVPRKGPRPAGPVRIVCTRKHEPVYDIETVVRALDLLHRSGVAFRARFVGGGSGLAATIAATKARGLEGLVEFSGNVEHAEIPRHLEWADVYVSAARADGAPSSLFEAMSCGLVPVVTDVRANRDWIEDGVNGFLFAVGDASECARKIERVARDPEGLASMLVRNRQMVKEKLDRGANLERLEALLQRVFAAKQAAK